MRLLKYWSKVIGLRLSPNLKNKMPICKSDALQKGFPNLFHYLKWWLAVITFDFDKASYGLFLIKANAMKWVSNCRSNTFNTEHVL